jgi:hypothetical protein
MSLYMRMSEFSVVHKSIGLMLTTFVTVTNIS